jgi:hypothetical protein
VASVILFWSTTAEVHADEQETSETSSGLREKVKHCIQDCGGPVIFWLQLARVFGSITLLALHFASVQNQRVVPGNLLLDQVGSGGNHHLPRQTRTIYLSFYLVYVSLHQYFAGPF